MRLRELVWSARLHSSAAGSAVRGTLKRLWHRTLPGSPLPIRLSGGIRWRAEDDIVGDAVFDGTFERAERMFVRAFLKPGMTFLDIGAHHGLYSLIAARCVGATGRVIAFEPSPRERKKLEAHLALNRTTNVAVEDLALGACGGETDLFLGLDGGFNTLSSAAAQGGVAKIPVRVMALDEYLASANLPRIDLVKLDVEGGELEIFEGARRVLERKPRPVILCEVDDQRTRGWGYDAVAIVRLIEGFGFRWYRPLRSGGIRPISSERRSFEGNLVAIPEERLGALRSMIKNTEL